MSSIASNTANLLAKYFHPRIDKWHGELTLHWEKLLAANAHSEVFVGWNLQERRIYEPVTSAAELADTHLRQIGDSFFHKVEQRFGNQFEAMSFVNVELEFLKPISGKTVYNGITRDWEADGRVELTGEVWHQNRVLQIRSVFVSHAFHQVRAI